jgi:hypothetical protein
MKIWIMLGFILHFNSAAFSASTPCPTNQYKVHAHYRRGYIRSDGTSVKATNVRSYCKERSTASDFALPRFQSKLPKNWPHLKEAATTWTEEEKEKVTEAIEQIPEILLSEKIIGIYRLKKSRDYPNPASSSEGIITIYDSAFEASRNLGQIISHELAHQNFAELSEEAQQDYRRATGWHMKRRIAPSR